MLKAAKILAVIGQILSIISLVIMGIYTLIAIFASAVLVNIIKEAA